MDVNNYMVNFPMNKTMKRIKSVGQHASDEFDKAMANLEREMETKDENMSSKQTMSADDQLETYWNRKHVFFWALPIGTVFEHKGIIYEKTGEERAFDYRGNKSVVFDIKHGCLIPTKMFRDLGLRKESVRPIIRDNI